MQRLNRPTFNEDSQITKTGLEQKKVEKIVRQCYETYCANCGNDFECPFLLPNVYRSYLFASLTNLPLSYESLDASHPWLAYWTLHSLELFGEPIPENISGELIKFLLMCQFKDGGFGGGPDQIPHLATTYASVLALCILQRPEGYEVINRPGLRQFFTQCLQKDGSFIVHDGGEVDIRGLYCSLAICKLLNFSLKPVDIMLCADWLAKCQTYEGGFGAFPDCEAHGGYTFCGAASLVLLYDQMQQHKKLEDQKFPIIDLNKLTKWVANKQMSFEGGFQGRTNKLVDACYSFWQGAIFPIINLFHQKLGKHPSNCTFNTDALEQYLLICCQHIKGGLIDKPGKSRDLYHTCYGLSGLSIAQHEKAQSLTNNGNKDFDPMEINGFSRLKITNPVMNITEEAYEKAVNYFSQKETLYL